MKRKILILITVCLVILLCGCGKVDITCEVTEDNVVTMEMRVEIPENDIDYMNLMSLRTAIHIVHDYWVEQGLVVQEDLYRDPIILIGKWEKQADNEKEAYDALLSFMTDGLSPFIDVEGGYSPAFFSDKRYLKAKLDFTNVVSSTTLDQLPPSQRQSIVDKIDNMDGRVTFKLPGEVIDSDGIVEENYVYKELDFDNEMTIMVTTDYKNVENIDEYNKLNSSIPEQKKRVIILAIVFGVLLLLAIFSVILFCKVVRRNSSSKY
jgi:hypothetical protein